MSKLWSVQFVEPCGDVWFLLDGPVNIQKDIKTIIGWVATPSATQSPQRGTVKVWPEIRPLAILLWLQTRRMTRDATPGAYDTPPEAPNGGAGSERSLAECRAALDEMSAEAERLGLHY